MSGFSQLIEGDQTAAGVAAAAEFLARIAEIEGTSVENEDPTLRAMSLVCSAVQCIAGAVAEDQSVPSAALAFIVGTGLGVGGTAGLQADPQVFGAALARLVDGYREGFSRSRGLVTPTGPLQ